MPFRFPLQAVFHFRQSVEHQQEMCLRAAIQKVARVHHLLERLDECLEQAHLLRREALRAGTTSAELHLELMREDWLHEQEQALKRELSRLESLRDQQRRAFDHARQQREIIESLRTRQLGEYERDAVKRGQRQLDDLFLLRQSYLRRG